MAGSRRVTRPLLDVVERLLDADARGQDLYGWQIMKDTKRTGPTVYGVLDRLEELGWITRYWESLSADENRPRRRLYRLTSEGRTAVRDLLGERRPGTVSAPELHRDPSAKPPGTPLPEGA